MPISQSNPMPNNAEMREALLSSRTALFVGAHPDDVEYRAGGLVHLMRRRGVQVTFAIATRGGKGMPGPLKRAIERVRTRYQLRAAEILGGVEILFHDYPDGMLGYFREQFTQDLKTLIAERQPDIVLGWDPDYILTPHPDHTAAAEATRSATQGANLIYYGTRQPDLWVEMDRADVDAQIRALKAHRTETPWFYFDLRQKKWLLRRLRHEGAKAGAGYAETLRRA